MFSIERKKEEAGNEVEESTKMSNENQGIRQENMEAEHNGGQSENTLIMAKVMEGFEEKKER